MAAGDWVRAVRFVHDRRRRLLFRVAGPGSRAAACLRLVRAAAALLSRPVPLPVALDVGLAVLFLSDAEDEEPRDLASSSPSSSSSASWEQVSEP